MTAHMITEYFFEWLEEVPHLNCFELHILIYLTH